MFANGPALAAVEDPLTYLPRKPVQEFARRQVIYDAQRPTGCLYLVILGRVTVRLNSDDGYQTIARIICAEGIFGESALIGTTAREETAVALDDVTVMAWSREEIETQIEREPRLGLAMAQYMVRQCLELQERIESLAIHKTPERIMLALAQLAGAMGTAMPDNATRIPAITHHTLAEYVGTSREIVTFQLNRLRRKGCLRYTRKYIDVYVPAIDAELLSQGVQPPPRQAAGGHLRQAAT
ncbi:MAG TPA: Crp/Fnr family transcriptional regulator [Bryobacteraceae bacterium]|nr:Crp/Fnr family transcriptional regulator [Bryobacteraceae bacterium]